MAGANPALLTNILVSMVDGCQFMFWGLGFRIYGLGLKSYPPEGRSLHLEEPVIRFLCRGNAGAVNRQTASKRRGNNWKDFEDFELKAKARIWP